MKILPQPLSNIFRRIRLLTILQRLLIGNSVIIIFGAVAGTLLTRHFTLMGDIKLILLFSSIGILFTLSFNYWIVTQALRPLEELRAALDRQENGKIVIPESLLIQLDPEIHQVVTTIQSMVVGLERRTLQLRALSERAINVQEEERNRIARNLHDDTAQAMSMIIIHLEQLESLIPEQETVLASRLAEARRLAVAALDDIRKIIWDLRPSILDDLGLVPAIRWYARFALEPSGITVDFDLGEIDRSNPHLETLLFRVTQEAVSNILRHAHAKHVSIRLYQKHQQIWLEIEDDGLGFDVSRTVGEAVFQKKLGLLGIQERVSLVGGEVNIQSTPGRGVYMQVCVPIFNGNSLTNGAVEDWKQEQPVLERNKKSGS